MLCLYTIAQRILLFDASNCSGLRTKMIANVIFRRIKICAVGVTLTLKSYDWAKLQIQKRRGNRL